MGKLKKLSIPLLLTYLLSILIAVPVWAAPVSEDQYTLTVSGKIGTQKETLNFLEYNGKNEPVKVAKEVEVVLVQPDAEITFVAKSSLIGAVVSFAATDGALKQMEGLAWQIGDYTDLISFLDPGTTAKAKMKADFPYYKLHIANFEDRTETNIYFKIDKGDIKPEPTPAATAAPVEATPTATAAPQSTPAPADAPDTWAKPEVDQAVSLKLVPADLQNKYTENITRADFCKLVVNLLTAKTGKTVNALLEENKVSIKAGVFTDTSDDTVLAANALGIVGGKGNGLFDPNGSITRQEAAVMLQRTAKVLNFKLEAVEKIEFSDSSAFESWAVEAIAFVSTATDAQSNTKVMGGTGNNLFSPADTYTRQQAFITVKRLFNAIK